MNQEQYEAALAANTVRTTMDTVPVDENTPPFDIDQPLTRRIDVDGVKMVLKERPLTFEEWVRDQENA